MKKTKILWTDDEIDSLRAHIIFLQEKGFEVVTANNGSDAIELVKTNFFDIIFLDENMPGLSGLQTLSEIKTIDPNVPVVMITKSEEEYITQEYINELEAEMLKAAEELAFERAAELRDKIQQLKKSVGQWGQT